MYDRALKNVDKTCRVVSQINSPKSLIILADLIELQPLPSEDSEMYEEDGKKDRMTEEGFSKDVV
jgi:hypothetical protein